MEDYSSKILSNNEKHHTINIALQTLLHTTSDMIFVKDKDSVYAAASAAFLRFFNKASVDELNGKTDMDLIPSAELVEKFISEDKIVLETKIPLINQIDVIPDTDSKNRYLKVSKYPLSDANGTIIGILGVLRDITQEYMIKQSYYQELDYLFSMSNDTYAVVHIDITDWRILRESRKNIHLIEIPYCSTSSADSFFQAALEGIAYKDEAHAFYSAFSKEAMEAIYHTGKRDFSIEYCRTMPDESHRWVKDKIHYLTNPESGHLCVIFQMKDIHDQKHAELSLKYAANTDGLTNLLNRACTMDSIHQYLASNDSSDKFHALFVIDVDNFKSINDTYGHQAGDALLVSLAKQLKLCFRESDIIGRIGGDEFFVLMKNIPTDTAVWNKANDLHHALQAVYDEHHSVDVSISVGVSIYDIDGTTLEELYAHADKALYKAKHLGKNRTVFASGDYSY